MRLRMYGSTETQTFSTSTSPSPGCLPSPSRTSKSDSCGSPSGLRARTTSRLIRSRRDRHVRDEALAREQLARLVEREVLRRQHGVRRHELLVREAGAAVADGRGQRLQPVPERALIVRLDGSHDRIVELVQPLEQRVVDAELPLAEQPDDHVASPSICFGASPCPSSAFIFASSSSTWLPCEICASCRSMSSPDEVRSVSAPDAVSSSTAFARACICSVLSFARWIASPTSAISSPIPVAASLIRTCASAAEYCALMTSFCVRKDSTFACSVRSPSISFCCCASSCCPCCMIPSSWPWTAALRDSASRARSSRPALSASRACPSSLSTCCCIVAYWSSSRFFAVVTSAMPRLTFCSWRSCASYE